VTQRWIEIVIGKLVTDEGLRQKYLSAPRETLLDLVERGMHLTHAEIAALIAIDSALWERAAKQIDVTLLKANPKNE
jgi:hypothetical protein